jgi:polygalacturonase
MVYARDATDVAITGEGTLDGSLAAAWNRGDDRAGILESQLARGIPPERRLVAGRLRTSMIQTVGCARVLIQGVTLSGAQFWQLHPILSVDVTIDGVTTKDSGANSDGCDPESCDRVVIRGCSFGSGDDNIALKSGRDEDGRRLAMPCRNVVIVGCQAEGRFGFITCGSEQSGGIENVYAFGNRTYGRGVGNAVWVKSNSRRGGYTRNLNVSGFRGHVRKAAVAITMKYDGQSGSFPPAFEGIHLADFAVDGAVSVLDAEGLPESRIRGLTLSDSTFTDVTAEDDVRHAEVMRRDVSVNGRPVR